MRLPSNCLIWALWRVFRDGGFLLSRKSKNWWGPHVLWAPDFCDECAAKIESYAPKTPKRKWLALAFFGEVKKGK